MSVTVRLFAILREAVGQDTIELAVEKPLSATEVLQKLADTYPELGRYQPMINFAVNGEYVSRDAQVKDGDEIAFIPPISGG